MDNVMKICEIIIQIWLFDLVSDVHTNSVECILKKFKKKKKKTQKIQKHVVEAVFNHATFIHWWIYMASVQG